MKLRLQHKSGVCALLPAQHVWRQQVTVLNSFPLLWKVWCDQAVILTLNETCSRVTTAAASFLVLLVLALQDDHVADVQQRLEASTEMQEVPDSVIISCCNTYCQNVNKKITSGVFRCI